MMNEEGRGIAMTTKLVDSKGRLALGSRFAGCMVIVNDDNPNQIVIRPAVAIPADQAWLFQNQQAMDLVRKGLEEARAGQFSTRPPVIGTETAAEADEA
jgi:hypothetical protein